MLEESSVNTPDGQKDEQGGQEQFKPETSLQATMTELRLSDFWHVMRRQGYFEINNAGEK